LDVSRDYRVATKGTRFDTEKVREKMLGYKRQPEREALVESKVKNPSASQIAKSKLKLCQPCMMPDVERRATAGSWREPRQRNVWCHQALAPETG
jgi:hypothetical protein